MARKTISVVAPVYNEEGNIELFYTRTSQLLKSLPYDYQIVFVNDGSRDSSLPLIIKLAQSDAKVKVINLSRNFGHQAAVTAGLENASGDAVAVIDTDLQDPPEFIAEMVKYWEQGYEVVNARRRSRKDSFFKVATARLFYKTLNMLVTAKMPENVGDFRLMDRKVVNVINSLREKDRYIRGLASWVGFKQIIVDFDRDQRYAGVTNYPFSKMLGLALNAIYSFSDLPLKLATYAGLFFIFLSFAIIAYALMVKIAGVDVPGWTSQVLIQIIFSAIELLVLGVISEYVRRIYKQTQDRPMYIISEVISQETPASKSANND